MLNIDARCKGFLGDLGSSIKRYPYKGWQLFLETWNAEYQQDRLEDASEWILLTDVDQHIFNRDFLNLDDQPPDWTSYDAALNLLLIKMPNHPPHECAVNTFTKIFMDSVQPTGLKYALKSIGSSVRHGERGGKQADNAWIPLRLPKDRSKYWPTVLVEVAHSQSESKLNSDVRFWLYESKGDVKIVITLKVDRHQPRLTIEKWELGNDRAHRTQDVTISKGGNGKVTVINSPLVIEFEKLFLRPATIPKETDIEIHAEQLEVLATMVWDAQDF